MGSETKKIDDEYLNGINALKLLNRRSISRIRNSLNNLELSTITKTEFINQCRGIYAESRIEYFNVSLEGFETEDMLELINFSNNDADVERKNFSLFVLKIFKLFNNKNNNNTQIAQLLAWTL